MSATSISVIVTAHNEGAEVRRTIKSIRRHTRCLQEIIVVDDGSDDGSCARLASRTVRVIRHEERIGVAFSRNEAACAASGDVLCFLDGHQRVTPSCLDRCAAIARRTDSIVSPEIRGLRGTSEPLYGASFRLCRKQGFFSAKWQLKRPEQRISQATALRGPGYLIPRNLYEDVRWLSGLRGWGGSEAAISLKAFFVGIPILYVRGPAVYHLFRRALPYPTTWEGVWRNQALIARICFDADTWRDYWLPQVFAPHLSDNVISELDSPDIVAENAAFRNKKKQTDEQFWRDLLGVKLPECLNHELPADSSSDSRAAARSLISNDTLLASTRPTRHTPAGG